MILEHTGTANYKPGVHWDLLCEAGEILRAWEFRETPWTLQPQLVHALPDHRRHYLEYEGPLSDERGSVRRLAAGTYELVTDTPTCWAVRLQGETFSGAIDLRRESPETDAWIASVVLQPLQPE